MSGAPQDLLDAIADAPPGPATGAFFDFDGTLIDGYSAVAVYRDRLRRLDVGPEEFARMLLAIADMQVRGTDVGALMRAALEGLAGRTDDDMVAFGERVFRDAIAGMVYPGARELVRAHRRAGHTVVIATSATRYQVEPLAHDLGADGLLCTQAEVVDGVLTGATDGPILWGEAKAEAIRAYADEHGVDLDASFAYGNGNEEEPLLRAVGRPAVLNPEDDIDRVARAAGWPVHRLQPPGGGFGVGPAIRTGAALTAMGWSAALGVGVRLLNRDKRLGANAATTIGSSAALALAGIDVRVEGAEHVEAARPAVFVFNHQSGLDMLVIGRVLGRDVTGVAKKEAARDPRFAPLGYLVDIAYVDRSDARQAREAMRPAVERLKAGTSIAIAPEGTRSPTPTVGRFKKGAFHLAMQAGVPVVPVVIRNAGELMWRNSFWLRPGTIEVKVLPPVPTRDWRAGTVGDHTAAVRDLFVRTLAEWE